MIKAVTASYCRPVSFKGNNDKITKIDDIKKDNMSPILSDGEKITIKNQEILNNKLDSIDKKVNSIFTFLLETANLKSQNMDLGKYVKDVGEKMYEENFEG